MYDVEIAWQRDVTSARRAFCRSKRSAMIDPALEPFQFPGQDSLPAEEREAADGGPCNLVKVVAWVVLYVPVFGARASGSRTLR
jgi:hypothetical protein